MISCRLDPLVFNGVVLLIVLHRRGLLNFHISPQRLTTAFQKEKELETQAMSLEVTTSQPLSCHQLPDLHDLGTNLSLLLEPLLELLLDI